MSKFNATKKKFFYMHIFMEIKFTFLKNYKQPFFKPCSNLHFFCLTILFYSFKKGQFFLKKLFSFENIQFINIIIKSRF